VLQGQFVSGTGPLWFCAALLVFCAAYAGWRALRGGRPIAAAALPTPAGVVLAVAGLTVSAFLVRLVWPLGSSVLNMQLCYFPSYILMFALGVVARDWLAKVTDRFAFTAAAICVGTAMLMWLPLLVLGGALRPGGISAFSGGATWQSAGLCLWEALICIGMSFAVLAGFRRWLAGEGRAAKFMSDNAFAVYVVHAPLLVGLALLLQPVALTPMAKFALLWTLGALVTFGLAAPLARRVPWVGRILQ
jgi:hypothetical protein